MPRNGSGTYTLPEAAFVPGTVISSVAVNTNLSDIAAALTDSVAADGQTTMTNSLLAYPGSAAAPSYTFGSSPTDGFYLSGSHQIGLAIAGAFVGFFNANGFNTTAGQPTGVPIGAVQDFAGSSPPPGWYLCSGQAISRTTYASLFARIGTTYGAGDGLNTFNIPDCRGRASFGKDDMGGTPAGRITVAAGNYDGTILGNAGGQQNQTLTTAQLPVTSPGLTFTGTPVTPVFTGSPLTVNSTVNNVATWNGTIFGTAAGGNQVPQSGGMTQNSPLASTGTPAGTIGAITPAGSISGSFGSGNTFSDLSPGIIFNKIIFAGA